MAFQGLFMGGTGDKNNHFNPRSPDFVQTDGMSGAVQVPLVEQLYGQSVALRQLHGPGTASSNHFIHGCQQFRHFEVSANGLGALKDGLALFSIMSLRSLFEFMRKAYQ
jgi:hypothetical protein